MNIVQKQFVSVFTKEPNAERILEVMESFIKDLIMTYMGAKNLLLLKQSGFINSRSTMTQLLSYLDKSTETIASGGLVDTIHLESIIWMLGTVRISGWVRAHVTYYAFFSLGVTILFLLGRKN